MTADDLGDDWWSEKQPAVASKKAKKRSADSGSKEAANWSVNMRGEFKGVDLRRFVDQHAATYQIDMDEFAAIDSRVTDLNVEDFVGESGLEEDDEWNIDATDFMRKLLWNIRSFDSESFPYDASSPVILVIASNANRCLQLKAAISPLVKNSSIVKLFAKHMKFEETHRFISTRRDCRFCVGTPARINMLAQSESLKLHALHYIIIDWNHRDAKQRTIRDVLETQRDLLLLLETLLIYARKKAKILLI